MSATLQQIYTLNPTTVINDTDLFYLVQSPYTPGTDAGISGASLKSIFVLSTAVIDTAHGGTGLVSPTAHDLLIGNGSSPLTLLPPSATAGVPLISHGAGIDPGYGTALVVGGGTGTTTFTAFSIICAGTTSTGSFQNVVGTGTLGQQLTSQGPGALPIWSSGGTGTVTSISAGTGITLTPDPIVSTGTVALTVPVATTNGGTGLTSYVLGDTLYASAANVLSALAGNITTAKQYLSQTGTGAVSAAPAWATIAGADITGAALTKTDDTNVTLTLGGTPTTALLRAASLTLGWTGELSLARGGTNASLTASNGGIFYSTSTAGAILAGTATARQMLQSGASAAPAWSTSTWPATTTANRILYSSATNTVGEITSAASSVLTTDGSSVPSFTTLANLGINANLVKTVKIQVFTTTGSQTYTPSSGLIDALVEICGGGGSGGGCSGGTAGQSAASAGGGGGGYCRKLYTAALIGASATVVIGAGGAAATAGNNNGNAGGDSTFTPAGAGAVLTAHGGSAGTACAKSASAQLITGVSGGTGVNGDVNISGQYSGYGATQAAAALALAGDGGDSYFGFGGRGATNTVAATRDAGRPPSGFGSGSSGSEDTGSADVASNAGKDGICIVTEFCNQ